MWHSTSGGFENKTIVSFRRFCFNNFHWGFTSKDLNYLIFRKSKYRNIDTMVNVNGINLKRVSNFKYLGVVLSDVLSIHDDSERVLNSFLRQFNGLFYKFNFIQSDILKFLFKTYSYVFLLWFRALVWNNFTQEMF